MHERSPRGNPLASEVLRCVVMLQRHRNGASSENLRNNLPTSDVSAAARRSGRNGVAGLLRRPRHGSLGRLNLRFAVLSAAGCGCILWLLFSLYSVSSPRSDEPTKLSTADVLEFQGTSRTVNNEGKPRIAIISNAVAFPYNSKTTALWSLFKEYFANKDCYANTHGYDLIIDSRYAAYLDHACGRIQRIEQRPLCPAVYACRIGGNMIAPQAAVSSTASAAGIKTGKQKLNRSRCLGADSTHHPSASVWQ